MESLFIKLRIVKQSKCLREKKQGHSSRKEPRQGCLGPLERKSRRQRSEPAGLHGLRKQVTETKAGPLETGLEG